MVTLTLLLVGLTVWMTRQILRPAEELERSRTEMRKMYETAREDSLRDGLTGLGNHRAFQEELDREIEWYQRYRVPVSLLMIDLDDLKLVNDSDGHAAGDELLREMGRLIGDIARYADRAFRIGGDEFAILMPHTDAEGAMQIAHRLLERALQPRGERHAPLPFSGGISACPQYATTRTQLYAQADAALYWCKRHGRASVDVLPPAARPRGEPGGDQRAVRADRQGRQRAPRSSGLPADRRPARPARDRLRGPESGRPPESGFADPGTMFKRGRDRRPDGRARPRVPARRHRRRARRCPRSSC